MRCDCCGIDWDEPFGFPPEPLEPGLERDLWLENKRRLEWQIAPSIFDAPTKAGHDGDPDGTVTFFVK